MTFLAVSCYDDRALREDIEELEDEVAGLAERMDSLERNLNVDVESINKLEALLKDFDGTLAKALEKNLTEVEAAFEEKLAELEEKLAAAIAEGDQASADALAAEKKTLEDAMAALETTLNGKLEEGLATLTTSLEELRATVTSLETLLGQKYEEILAKMDTADGLLDGKISDLNAALEQVKKDYASADAVKAELAAEIADLNAALEQLKKDYAAADAAVSAELAAEIANLNAALEQLKKDYAAADATVSAELAAEIAEVIAKIAVTDVKEDGEKVVLTLATGETIELSKTPAVSNEGLVTIVTDENGARFWAVVVNGEPESLGIMVGSDVQLEFRVVDNFLEFTTNGTDWKQTGAYVADDAEYLKFYQGETGDYVYDENWNMVPVLEDYYTFVYGGTEYYLPIYRADNSSVTIRAGKTYFTYGETKTEAIPALGHDWGEWEVTTEATCDEAGVETRVCKNDETHVETREIPAKGHDHGDEWKYDEENHWHECSCGHKADVEAHVFENNGYCKCGYLDPNYNPGGGNDDDEPQTGDITPVIVLGVFGVMAMAATVVVSNKRKNVK